MPLIADFFGISIDFLFGRSVTNYNNLRTALVTRIHETPINERIKLIFSYCWDMERGMMESAGKVSESTIEDFEKGFDKASQTYSLILLNNGFTQMGIANRSQYFLVVPSAKDSEKAYFDGIDYPTFFKDFSDKDLFDTLVFLNKRKEKTLFTAHGF